jgi:methylglyoxal synthase
VACDRATADFVISSPLMSGTYQRILPDYAKHVDRFKAPQKKLALLPESVR